MVATKTTTTIKALALGAALFLAVAGGLAVARGVAPDTGDYIRITMDDARDLALKERLPLLRAMRTMQEEALQGDVGDAYGWSRLATLRLLTQNHREGALTALRVSQMAAPYEPKLMVERARLFFSLRDLYSADDEAAMAREWRYAFFGDKAKLFRLLAKYPSMTAEDERAMVTDKEYDWWKAERRKAKL